MFKENPRTVDPLYCLSAIIGTRNTVVVAIITTITTIITCLSNCRQSAGAFCYKYNRWSCIFPPAFLGVGGEADVPRCDSAVHRVYRRPLALSHWVSVQTACDWSHPLLIPNIPSCGKHTSIVTIHMNAHFSFWKSHFFPNRLLLWEARVVGLSETEKAACIWIYFCSQRERVNLSVRKTVLQSDSFWDSSYTLSLAPLRFFIV